MSASESAAAGSNRDKSLSRFIRRASKAIRTGSSQRSSMVESGDVSMQSKTVTVPRPAPKASAPAAAPTSAGTAPAATRNTAAVQADRPINSAAAYMTLREDKARALFRKYGMSIESSEWARPEAPARTRNAAGDAVPPADWIEKRIVMRVHRTCHRCQTTFGPERECKSCGHAKCGKCPRFPVKRPRDERPGGDRYDPAARLAVDVRYAAPTATPKGVPMLGMPLALAREGKRDAVRHTPTQRVRRTCHRCEALFKGRATVCEGCGHARCPTCPRDPPKTKKHADGYPGDQPETFPLATRVPRTIRVRFRWECHTCAVPFVEHSKTCASCGHGRCDECPRKPPKKVRREPNPDVVRSVEEKLKTLGIGKAAAAGGGDASAGTPGGGEVAAGA